MLHKHLPTFLVAALLLVGSAGLAATASAGRHSYAPTLNVVWPYAAASTASSSGTFYVISGCGYDSSLGGVSVVVTSPYAVSTAGQMPDATGCISISNFDTLGSGHYVIDAYQKIHGKEKLVASTSFDV